MKLTDEDRTKLNEYRMALDNAEKEYSDLKIIYPAGTVISDEQTLVNHNKKQAYKEALRNWEDFNLELEEKGYDLNHIRNLDGEK